MRAPSKGDWADYVNKLYPKFSFWTATKTYN